MRRIGERAATLIWRVLFVGDSDPEGTTSAEYNFRLMGQDAAILSMFAALRPRRAVLAEIDRPGAGDHPIDRHMKRTGRTREAVRLPMRGRRTRSPGTCSIKPVLLRL